MTGKNFPFISVLIIFMLSISSFAQDLTQIEWLNELDKKENATYGDAVMIFSLQTGNKTSVSKKNSPLDSNLTLSGYTDRDKLSKGMLAKMTARYLDLGGSLMYMIFGTERYAYRACVAQGIMRGNGSENDMISGLELIEVLSKISDIKGEN